MIKFSQPMYINKILARFYLSWANISNTPMKKSLIELRGKEVIADQ